MKRLSPILAAALLAACGGNNSGSSGSTGSTTGNTTTTTTSSGTGTGSTTGVTSGGSTGLTSGGSTGLSGTTTSGSGSGSTGASSSGSSGSSGTTGGPPPANDLCANAIALTAHAPGDTETVTGDTTNAASDFDSSCGGGGGDVYYSLHLTAEAEVVLTMTPSDSARTAVPSIVQDCSATQELFCSTSSGSTPATTTAFDLQPGDYTVVADNYIGDEGPFTLDVAVNAPVHPPAGDVCTSATALTPAQPGDTQTVTGDTSAAADDFHSACGGYGGDVFYQFTLTAQASATATLTPTNAGTTSVVSIIDACGTTSTSSQCNEGAAGAAATVTRSFLAPGTYYVVADNTSGTNGPYSLNLTLSAPVPPLAGEFCAAIPADGGSDVVLGAVGDGGLAASLAVDTTPYANDSHSADNGACGGVGGGNDVVYRVTLANAAPSLTATLTPYPDAGTYEPVLYLRSSPCTDSALADGGPSSELACNSPPAGQAATITANNLAAGTYYLWVDGFGGTMGPATLDVTVP